MQKKRKQITYKILLARARENTVEQQRREREAKEKEDREWREAEGPKSRAAIKREEKNKRRAEAVAKKAEARLLASEEEKELERTMNRVKRVTALDLLQRKEEEQAAMIRRLEEEKNKQSRSLKSYEYKNMISVTNNNRDCSIIDARSVSDALAQMTMVVDLPPDKHPERRLKASYMAFEKAEIERLKEDKPNLTLGQYSDMSWKQWKKSPDNPLGDVKNYPKLYKIPKTSGRRICIVDDDDDFSVV